ncbi:MAG: phage tail sheath subtilisin-like domain-containing protein, partial [Acidobacteriota bacterium]
LLRDADGVNRSLPIVYDSPPAPGEVQIDLATGALNYAAGEAPAASDVTTVSYAVDSAHAVTVTLRLGAAKEIYTAISGRDLAADVDARSSWVTGEADAANGGEVPSASAGPDAFAAFGTGGNTRGDDGALATPGDYQDGLDALLGEPAHLILAAGQDESFGAALTAHCETASADEVQRERIAVVGAGPRTDFDALRGHSLASDRLIFVAPGFMAADRDGSTGEPAAFPAAYTAAAVAGRLSGLSAHVSLTNKTVALGALETEFTQPQLRQLVSARVLALESRDGVRVVKGITTSTNSAFHQITTRRIVDFAKFGVRSAARPFIGRLNNERVRGALRTSINSFLAQMVDDEKLVSYDLAVSATRAQEIRGIVAVEMTLLPTFSIDFVRVTMTLG